MLRSFCTMERKWCRMHPEFLQNAGGCKLGCKRNGHFAHAKGPQDNKLRSHSTFAPNGQTEKEAEKRDKLWENPLEFRQKIANCMKCPKWGYNKDEQETK